MKKFIIQSVALIIVILVALYFYKSQSRLLPPQIAPSTEVIIGSTRVKVEVADTAEKRSQGLGGRTSLASDSAMLFIFPKRDKYAFWMKGVKLPLDFIWIGGSGVVDIIKNAQPPEAGQKDESLPIYLPNQPIDKVLEVNAGFVESHGIKVGDTIEIVR